MSEDADSTSTEDQAAWKPLPPKQRRVLGVLIEKAKTTPDGYPMSLNALTNGCNQKSNRSPIMNLSPEDVEDALEGLRARGAAAEIHGNSRVAKYRHYAYDWFGVPKHGIAVLAELLLRGPQTIGELRGRASRMETIAGMAELKPVLADLISRGMLIELTPEGRGQIVTHALYPPEELAQLRKKFAAGGPRPERKAAAPVASAPAPSGWENELAELRTAVKELTARVEELESQLR